MVARCGRGVLSTRRLRCSGSTALIPALVTALARPAAAVSLVAIAAAPVAAIREGSPTSRAAARPEVAPEDETLNATPDQPRIRVSPRHVGSDGSRHLQPVPAPSAGGGAGTPAGQTADDPYRTRREGMVDLQIAARGIRDERVLAAMRRVPRERFVPASLRDAAYADRPLPIGHDQTISQPFIVGYMTELLGLTAESRVLEVGTGSGYQAAVLAELAREVYTIEIVEALAAGAGAVLAQLGYDNVHTRTGDGYQGWSEAGPFDAIVVTAAPDHVPQPLVDQLAVGGRLVIPVGNLRQEILRLSRTPTGIEEERLIPVLFVPLVRDPR